MRQKCFSGGGGREVKKKIAESLAKGFDSFHKRPERRNSFENLAFEDLDKAKHWLYLDSVNTSSS